MYNWDSNKYSVGDQTIDAQHEKLFSIINDVYNSIINSDKKSTHPLLLELLEYTNNHYTDEIEYLLFNNINNDYIINHLRQHHENLSNLIDIIQKSLIDEDLIIVDVALLLNDWITNHIIKYDIPIFREIKTKLI